MPFDDPAWVQVAKHFLEEYHLRIRQGEFKDLTELVRFTLRLLKSSANNVNRSIVLTEKNEDERYTSVYGGKTDKKPKLDIFSGPSMMYSSMALLSAKINAHNAKENSIAPKAKRNRRWAWGILGLIVGLILGSLW